MKLVVAIIQPTKRDPSLNVPTCAPPAKTEIHNGLAVELEMLFYESLPVSLGHFWETHGNVDTGDFAPLRVAPVELRAHIVTQFQGKAPR